VFLNCLIVPNVLVYFYKYYIWVLLFIVLWVFFFMVFKNKKEGFITPYKIRMCKFLFPLVLVGSSSVSAKLGWKIVFLKLICFPNEISTTKVLFLLSFIVCYRHYNLEFDQTRLVRFSEGPLSLSLSVPSCLCVLVCSRVLFTLG
jgi:hypothetical protein